MRSLTASLAALATLASLASAAPIICGARQYPDGVTCKPCPINMMSCTSATTATSCSDGWYLTADKRCVLKADCPPNTFADSTTRTCAKCYVKDAATCTDTSVSGTTSCMTGCLYTISCLPASRLPGGWYCPDHVATPCPDSAAEHCDASGVTTSCKPGYNLGSDGYCVKCTNGTVFDTDSKTCICPHAQFDSSGHIVVHPTYRDPSSGMCVSCLTDSAACVFPRCAPTYAAACDIVTGAATYCAEAYLDGGHCYLSCPAGTTTSYVNPRPAWFPANVFSGVCT